MDDFTLDTSGAIELPIARPSAAQPYTHTRQHAAPVRWSDLSPFAQGFVEALFASVTDFLWDEMQGHVPKGQERELGFRDLAPETLAAILRDRERLLTGPDGRQSEAADAIDATAERDPRDVDEVWRDAGAAFYTVSGREPYLGDDGKVYLREPA